MIFTYLKIQDLLKMAGKEKIQDLFSLAQELELRYPKNYTYRIVLDYLIREEDERARRIKKSLFGHILEILGIDPHDVSNRFIEQPIIT